MHLVKYWAEQHR